MCLKLKQAELRLQTKKGTCNAFSHASTEMSKYSGDFWSTVLKNSIEYAIGAHLQLIFNDFIQNSF